ncbi:MAG: membrane protein insertion efficiency factor YidD [Phycisphaeraceae bacterium]|nr:membrane protein insertion efficiency factor YidD [Phycisphaeraceae bacterium]
MVACYRATLGHFIGGHCRFQPTCSQYMLDAVKKYGPWHGFFKGLRRIGRCHPWGGCGHDPA